MSADRPLPLTMTAEREAAIRAFSQLRPHIGTIGEAVGDVLRELDATRERFEAFKQESGRALQAANYAIMDHRCAPPFHGDADTDDLGVTEGGIPK